MIHSWIRAALTTASTITMLTIGVLYAIAYGVIGFGIGAAIDTTGLGTPGLYAWLFIWVGAGTIALTVWTIRVAGVDVRRQPRTAMTATTTEPPCPAPPVPTVDREPTQLISFHDQGD